MKKPEIDVETVLSSVLGDEKRELAAREEVARLTLSLFFPEWECSQNPPHEDPIAIMTLFTLVKLKRSRNEGHASEIVEQHARNGTRPDWMPSPPRWEPDRGWRRRKGSKERMAVTSTSALQPGVRWCKVTLRPAPETIAYARSIYSLWWVTLLYLRETMNAVPGLDVPIFITGPAVLQRPWEGYSAR